MTCWRRLHEWQEAGVRAELHAVLLDRLAEADQLDWSRCSLDSATVPAPLTESGGEAAGPSPIDRGKRGTKRHVLVDRRGRESGTPLSVVLTGANTNDCKVLEEAVAAIPPTCNGRRGRPRFRPKKLHAPKGYDFAFCREALRKRHITPRIARRGIGSKDR